LANPESTAVSEEEAKKEMGNIAAEVMKRRKNRKRNRKNKNKKNGKKNSKDTTAAADTTADSEPEVEEAPVEDLGPMKVKTGDVTSSGGLGINPNQPTEPLGITSSTDPKTGRRRMYI